MSIVTNATMTKFGYPGTLVAETDDWAVLARPQQVTLGSLVLVHRKPATAFGQVSPASMAAMQPVVAAIEEMLKAFTAYGKINYLMLMMVDPDVHFHVIPRYEGKRSFEGIDFPDAGWPGPPNLGAAIAPPGPVLDRIVAALRAHWKG
jgi:diadenosine tetraphosphate (Ap4A) HIT family hydrolase